MLALLKSLPGIIMVVGVVGSIAGGYGTYRWVALSARFDAQAEALGQAQELARRQNETIASLRASLGGLEAAVARQNAGLAELEAARAAALAESRVAGARAEHEARRRAALARALADMKPEAADACGRASALLRHVVAAGRPE